MSKHTDSEAFHTGPSSETLQRPDGVQWRVLPSWGLLGAVQGGWSRQRGPRGQRPAPPGNRQEALRGARRGQVRADLLPWGGAGRQAPRNPSRFHRGACPGKHPLEQRQPPGHPQKGCSGRGQAPRPWRQISPQLQSPRPRGEDRLYEERRTRGGPLAGFWGVRGWPVLPPDPRSLKLGS